MPRSKIHFNVLVDKATGCWNWQKCAGSDGYGQIRVDGKLWKAHRLSFTLFRDEDIEGKVLLHSCDNRVCVNPDHLSVGTHQDNSDDKVAKGRHVFGELVNSAKLDPAKVVLVHNLTALGVPQQEIARRLNVHRRTINRVVSGESWKHLHPTKGKSNG